MLVQFFTVEVTESQDINTLISQLSNDIPISVCMEFSNISSKHTFCVDASIDVQQICTNIGFLFEPAHNLEVEIEDSMNKYAIGVNFGETITYHLVKIRPPVDLETTPI